MSNRRGLEVWASPPATRLAAFGFGVDLFLKTAPLVLFCDALNGFNSVAALDRRGLFRRVSDGFGFGLAVAYRRVSALPGSLDAFAFGLLWLPLGLALSGGATG